MGIGIGIGTGGLEVKLSPRTVEDDGGAVVSSGGVFSGGEGSEPLTGTLTWLTDLGDPFAPATLSHTTVSEFVVVGSTFAFAALAAIIGVVGGDADATTTVIITVVAVGTVRCFAGSGGYCGGYILG